MHTLRLSTGVPSTLEPTLPSASRHRRHPRGGRPAALPSTSADWSRYLARRWGLSLVVPPTRAPLRLVVTDGSAVLEFTGLGTRLRLRVYEPRVLRTVVLTPDCDCGAPHADPYGTSPEHKVILDPWLPPLREVVRDGAALYGWTGIAAATLPVAEAAAHLDDLLASLG